VSTRTFLARALVLYTLLTGVMTYPQVLHLTDAVHDYGDPLYCTWALSWIAHQLPRDPTHLFDANIFHPERWTLAYSEALLAPGILVAPLRWAGVGPVLIYNLVFLSGFAISGVGTALLVRRLTSSAAAGLLAGFVFAFLPFRIDHYAHLQLQQTQFLPLALWAFHRLLQRGRPVDGVLFGAFAAGQALSCLYYGVSLVPYLMAVCGTMLVAERAFTKERLRALAVAAGVALLALLPIGEAYLSARMVVGERNRAEAAAGSATLTNYLAPSEANAVYGRAFRRFMQPERRLFPGFTVMVLALVGLWPPLSSTRLAYGLGLLIALDLSLGLNGFLYAPLYDYFPPFRALRVPARIGMLVGFTLAVLAGYGSARIVSRVRSSRARTTVFAVLFSFVLIEYASKPIELQPIPAPLGIYADLVADRGDPASPVLEFPISPGDDATYMYYATSHWHPLVNGYSGFFPASYVDIVRDMRGFPDEVSIDAVKRTGVRYLIIHGERLRGDRYETLLPQLDRRSDMQLVSRRPSERLGQHGEVSLYRVLY
jgi:hypothetical protein